MYTCNLSFLEVIPVYIPINSRRKGLALLAQYVSEFVICILFVSSFHALYLFFFGVVDHFLIDLQELFTYHITLFFYLTVEIHWSPTAG